MNEQDEKELADIRQWKAELDRREAAVLEKTGEGAPSTMSARLREEKEGAELYDSLTPVELLDLYTHQRDEWDRIMKAKEAAGLRKILRK